MKGTKIMKQDSKNYKVRCVGYKRSERHFTIGKVYDVVDGKITNDNGHTYSGWQDVIDFLSGWYKFEKVSDDTPISRVIFNDPATIILWADGTKTVAKTHGDDAFDPEKGFAVACAKKLLGNGGAFRWEFAKWAPVEKAEAEPNIDGFNVGERCRWLGSKRLKHFDDCPLTEDELYAMQGNKVWLVSLDKDGKPDTDKGTMKEYGGWHTVKGTALYDEDGEFYDINSVDTPFGFHAYREPPKK